MLTAGKIRALRIANKLTQKDMAELSGITQGTYNGIEYGKSPLTPEREEKIAEVFQQLGVYMPEKKNLPKPKHEVIEEKQDPVNHPSHYADRQYEVIDVMKDTMTDEQFEGYLIGCALKYIMRWDKKGQAKQDLGKAIWYLNKLLETTTRGGN